MRVEFPFAAIVSLERPRQTLKLLAVDPGLKGLLLVAPRGSGKTLLVRSFPSILPDGVCGTAFGREVASTPAPIIEVPIGVTEDMLLGGLDLGATLAEGSRRVSKGLLARADGGYISVDHIDLLDQVNLRHLLAALDLGFVRIERDGISSRHPARFALIGTVGAWDETTTSLKDRVGLISELHETASEAERADIVARTEESIANPRGFWSQFTEQTNELRRQIAAARLRLGGLKMDRVQKSRLASIALDLGIESSRADLFAARAARASAALRGGLRVEEVDVAAAVEFVLLPRATASITNQRLASEFPADPSTEQRQSRPRGHVGEHAPETTIDDLVLQPQDCPLPSDLADIHPKSQASLGRAGARSGRRSERNGRTHGRYVGAVAPSSRHTHPRRIAIDATLRAAAPLQRARRSPVDSLCSHSGRSSDRSTDAAARLSDSGNLQAPASEVADTEPHGKTRVIVKPVDLRLKKLKHRSGTLFVLLVDTSGSMALGRIGHAKGVMIRMLRQAYLHRDEVALIAFRGKSVEILLEPTASVELARRAIESMPAGGGTPLAAGLAGAIAMAQRVRRKAPREITLVIFTDGRVNVALQTTALLSKTGREAAIMAELQQMARRLREEDVRAIVVDTRSSWHRKDDRCASISAAIGARYLRLPDAGPEELYQQIRDDG